MSFLNGIVKSFIERFFSKNGIIGFVAALLMAIVAIPLGMSSSELKSAVCSAPQVTIEKPKVEEKPEVKVEDARKP